MRSDKGKGAALLWDESYLWGLFALRSLNALGLSFDLISTADVKEGALERYGTLMVPGGWASNKIKALGTTGAEAIVKFVRDGGNYFGICGGAGLATGDGLGLLDISRKPTKERVPSLSGPVRLGLVDHPVWDGTGEPVFNVWWPSQFVLNDSGIKVLAVFDGATDETMSSDLRVRDVNPGGWKEMEKAYGLNLDPARMKGEPVVIEASSGKGRVILSLVHFDTPGDPHGAVVLRNLWRYLEADGTTQAGHKSTDELRIKGRTPLYKASAEPFDQGLGYSLWQRRGPLISWRRGVRGLAYFTLYTLAEELNRLGADTGDEADSLAIEVEGFSRKAAELLRLEHKALEKGEAINFRKSSGERMATLRDELFSKNKSHGGLFRSVIKQLDSLLFRALRAR